MKKIIALLGIVFLFITFRLLSQPTAIVVPHHNLVIDIRQQFLKTVGEKRLITKKIILIGPDHFSANQKQINISTRNWNLSTGIFNFEDLNFDLPQNDLLLQADHAIYNPLADLKTTFPNATIYPILIGQKVDQSKLDDLLIKIKKSCSFDCLLVASVDFSHYLPATLAEVHDTYTLKQLQNLDQNILLSEVDSPQSLYLLSQFAKSRNTQKWKMFAHTNSGFMFHHPDYETTTHVFGSYSFGIKKINHTYTKTISPANFDRSWGVDEFVVDPQLSYLKATVTDLKTTISILPFKNNWFIIGSEKQKIIKDYLDSIQNNQLITKDYFWGKIIYEHQN